MALCKQQREQTDRKEAEFTAHKQAKKKEITISKQAIKQPQLKGKTANQKQKNKAKQKIYINIRESCNNEGVQMSIQDNGKSRSGGRIKQPQHLTGYKKIPKLQNSLQRIMYFNFSLISHVVVEIFNLKAGGFIWQMGCALCGSVHVTGLTSS